MALSSGGLERLIFAEILRVFNQTANLLPEAKFP